MGCDIHMHVEYKYMDAWRCGDYYKKTYDNRGDEYRYIDLYGDRDYGLFAILANVRNSRLNLMYIDSPRGLPADVTEEVKQDYDVWGDDAHSCSYFTLRELIDFYDEHGNDPDYEALGEVIDRIKYRAEDFNIAWRSTWLHNYDRAYERSNDIRIVFWFDN